MKSRSIVVDKRRDEFQRIKMRTMEKGEERRKGRVGMETDRHTYVYLTR